MTNLLSPLPGPLPDELVEVLASTATVRIERIVSHGQVSPPGFWYDQEEHEWVVVLTGRARLRFEDEESDRDLGPGDFVAIPPHRRHRVTWTCDAEPTVWLAVFARAGSPAS